MFKFAVQILYFDCDQFILRTIANCAPFVDKIFIIYSPEPWSAYNKDARKLYSNPSDPEILKKSPFFSKIQLIEGVWDTEEDQRNACLDIAKEQGFDYLIIQDADEFYLYDEYKKNIDGIIKNPEYDYYRNPWILFWKNIRTILLNLHPISHKNYKFQRPYTLTRFSYNANFAMNLNKGVRFSDKRLPSSTSFFLLNGFCHHLTLVLNDEQLERKLQTWGHSHQISLKFWLETKWYCWNGHQMNLNLIEPGNWPVTCNYDGPIPAELEDYEPGLQKFQKARLHKIILSYFVGLESYNNMLLKDVMFVFRLLIKILVKK